MIIEKLLEDFDIYGLHPTDKNVLEKCAQYCEEYDLCAEELAVRWLAFAALFGHNEMTFEGLIPFEKQELSTHKNNPKTPEETSKHSFIPTSDQDDELLAAYGASPAARPHKVGPNTSTPIRQKLSSQEVNKKKKFIEAKKDFLLNSPAANTPSQKYSSRNNAGTVVCSVGASDPRPEVSSNSYLPEVTTKGFSESPITAEYEYMFEKLRLNAFALEDSMGDIADMMKEFFNIEEWSPVTVTSNEELWFLGRVCCDSNGRLNAASVMLEGSREDSSGLSVKLDLSKLPNYSIFPGQVIAVKGVNASGNCIVAKEIIPGICPPASKASISLKQDLTINIACGPFTTSDNLLFEPLSDFLKQVASGPPQVLILIGPLVGSDHPLLADDDFNETLDSVASYCINMIATRLQDSEVKTFILSSSRDVDCQPIYPTPPRLIDDLKNIKNITTLPDPSLLVIEGLTIAITATDVIMDLSREEISFPPQSFDRLARLSQHLLQQQTFYPLYPPPEEFALCLQQWESHARFTFTPNILIVPSNMRCFVKELENCLVVNPERLAKGRVGGCYANLSICCGSTEKPVINAEIIKI